MSRFLIVESPNKAKKISEMYGDSVKVMATFGHICDLPSKPKEGVGINRETMKGEYELTEDKTRRYDGKRTVAELKKYIAANPKAEIFLGTDPDREGESISAFVMKYLKLSNPKRVKFHEITKKSMDAAFQDAGTIDWGAVNSREARRLIDRIVGFIVSPMLRTITKEKSAAAGRVQTAVEALVIERERKIRNHTAITHYKVSYDMGGWEAHWLIPNTKAKRTGPKTNSEFDLDDNTALCLEEAQAKRAASFQGLVVKSCTDKISESQPPSPFYTFSLLPVANKVLGWDADTTMRVAQELFVGDGSGHGHITYHRTDSPNLSEGSTHEIRALLKQLNLPLADKPNHWKNKNKQAQEGHEAIRPTYLDVEEAGATDEQRALYRIIRERALYSQLAPARYAVKKIVLVDPVNGDHQFSASARTLVDPGWKATAAVNNPAMLITSDDDEEADTALLLPDLKQGSMVNTLNAEVQTRITQAPSRYSVVTLTAKLEVLSIGRPATLASILKNIQAKGTVVIRKDKMLEATRLAEKVYDLLYPRCAFAHIGYTAELEQALDQIAEGKLDGQALVRAVWDRLDSDCATILAESKPAPKE